MKLLLKAIWQAIQVLLCFAVVVAIIVGWVQLSELWQVITFCIFGFLVLVLIIYLSYFPDGGGFD